MKPSKRRRNNDFDDSVQTETPPMPNNAELNKELQVVEPRKL